MSIQRINCSPKEVTNPRQKKKWLLFFKKIPPTVTKSDPLKFEDLNLVIRYVKIQVLQVIVFNPMWQTVFFFCLAGSVSKLPSAKICNFNFLS